MEIIGIKIPDVVLSVFKDWCDITEIPYKECNFKLFIKDCLLLYKDDLISFEFYYMEDYQRIMAVDNKQYNYLLFSHNNQGFCIDLMQKSLAIMNYKINKNSILR